VSRLSERAEGASETLQPEKAALALVLFIAFEPHLPVELADTAARS